MGHCKSSAKGKVHSNTGIPQETRKKSNNLTPHLKQLEKEEMENPRVSRRKEILKIRAEINAKETNKTIAKFNKTKSWFFDRINKIDKPLARLTKKQREKNQMNKIRNENGEITTDNTEIQRIMRLLSAIICQYNGQRGKNGKILRKVQLSKTEPGRNRKS